MPNNNTNNAVAAVHTSVNQVNDDDSVAQDGEHANDNESTSRVNTAGASALSAGDAGINSSSQATAAEESASPSWPLFRVARARLSQVYEQLCAPAIRQASAERRSSIVASVIPLLRELVPTLPLLQPHEQEQLMALMESIQRVLTTLSSSSSSSRASVQSDHTAAPPVIDDNNDNSHDNNSNNEDADWADIEDEDEEDAEETAQEQSHVTRLHAVLSGVQTITRRIQSAEWQQCDAASQCACAREWVRELRDYRDSVDAILADASASTAATGGPPLQRVIDHLITELQPLAESMSRHEAIGDRLNRAQGHNTHNSDDTNDNNESNVYHHAPRSAPTAAASLQSEGVEALINTLHTVSAITRESTFAAEQGPQAVLLLLRRVLDDTEAAGVRWRHSAEATQLVRDILSRVDQACQHRLGRLPNPDERDDDENDDANDGNDSANESSENDTRSSNDHNHAGTSHNDQVDDHDDVWSAIRALGALVSSDNNNDSDNALLSERETAEALLTVSYALREATTPVSLARMHTLREILSRLRRRLTGQTERMTPALLDCVSAVEHQLRAMRSTSETDEETGHADAESIDEEETSMSDSEEDGGEENGNETVRCEAKQEAVGLDMGNTEGEGERRDAAFVEDDAEGSLSGE